jgi:hypothetical protein
VQVNNEYIRGACVPVGAAGSHNDVVLEITFSALWDGLAKKITWLDAKGANPTLTIITADMLKAGETSVYLVKIPAEPKAYAGDMTMTIKGATVFDGVETRATLSTSCTFRVLPSSYDSSADESGDVTPTQAEQLQAEIDTIIGTISEAAASATAAAGSAADAAEDATLSESWAVGGTNTRAGEDTNNAHYWSIVAQGAAAGGVSTFNGRSGAVVPASGDYTPAQVGADAAGSAAAALASAKSYADGLAGNYDASGAAAAVQSDLNDHTGNTSNPHGVTKSQVGLGSVPNVATNDQTPTYSQAGTLANLSSGEKLSVSLGKIMKAIADFITHKNSTSNPHGVTAAQAGADPSGTAASAIYTHNGATDAHSSLFKYFGLKPQIVVTAPTGSNVTCTKGTTTLTAAESSGTWTFNVPEYGTWTVNATQSGNSASKSVAVDTVKQYSVALAYYHIYGVEWDGTSSTALSRTDDAELFADPSPAVSSGNGSSPFDSLLPWSGMVKDTRNGSVMVKIPKFWFKWTKTGSKLKLQIADAAVSGFSVSPAHMDRGDGCGERDYVYVGRYHCGSSAYKSVSGQSPKANITRSAARTAIHNLGTTTWQMDYAMRLTIQMLYLVEYADWNSQAKIGYGCGNNSAAQSMGYTDSMTYHTGTTQSARTTYGLGTQYRWIEGLWDNVYDWMDGCYYNGSGLNIIKNPANFSDSANGTAVGAPSSGYPKVMNISAVSGFEWVMYPTTADGGDSTYIPDYWYFNSSSPCLLVGGNYYQGQNHGLFYVYCDGTSSANAYIGCRLQELP